MNMSIKINSPSRLHLGFIELDKSAPRNFGSIGLTISQFQNVILIKESKKYEIESKNEYVKLKINEIFEKFKKKFVFKPFKIEVHETTPSHVGLGSGTQLALTIGLLISEFHNLKLSFKDIVKISGRGLRSGVGIESFNNGGFIVDCGKGNMTTIPPVFFRTEWPDKWKIILILDNSFKGLSGNDEKKQFEVISKIEPNISMINSQTLLMNIIPSIIENNFTNFCKGIQIIQENMSRVFYNDEKKFASKGVEKIFNFLNKKKIMGYGQSSWGPSGFVFCENVKKRNELLIDIKKYMKYSGLNNLTLEKVDGRNQGCIKTE